MKILVFSDSHNNPGLMDKAIRLNVGHGLEAVFFLGDGYSDFERVAAKHPGPQYYGVLGNCDSYRLLAGGSYEKTVDLGGHRFLLVHGHRHGVKSGIGGAVNYAASKGADVLLYGHTHEAFDEPLDAADGTSVRTINPGSVGAFYGASFALLDLLPDGTIVCGFGGEK
ncbi:MAG: YfcE family phosphodiesterase [Clostridia bacterium]|nr:YfcE family phosphodiesterase [Clostridia bacterium]MBR5364779.1 YfcE family phosphodiesterase [Clostridia bacterium]MBR5679355.1 YfcE family phosphodiesterase [Clostridia bacterium]